MVDDALMDKLIERPLDWAACGTEKQAKAHRRRGEKPCGPCLEAESRADRERRQKRREMRRAGI